MLDVRIKEQLKDKLLRYQAQAVEIAAAFDPGAESAKLRELLDEIVSVSARLNLVEASGDEMAAPSFSIGVPGEAPRIRFCGVPTGSEFTSVVLAILQVGGHRPKFDEALLAGIAALGGDYAFDTFVSLTCPYCQEVVQALNGIAALNPGIRHRVVDIGLFPEEARARGIEVVPTILMNEEWFGEGRTTATQIAARLAGIEADMREALRAAGIEP